MILPHIDRVSHLSTTDGIIRPGQVSLAKLAAEKIAQFRETYPRS
jgi:hypothetical protein